MQTFPPREKMRELALAQKWRVAPLATEIFADTLTPLTALRLLKHAGHHCFILESVEDQQKWGRYTFLGFDPQGEITALGGQMTVKKAGGVSTTSPFSFSAIREFLADYRSPHLPELPPFTGGLVGYFSYDFIKYVEPQLSLDAHDAENFNDLDLMLFDKVIAFDHLKQKIILIVNISLGAWENCYAKGAVALENLRTLLKEYPPATLPSPKIKSDFRYLFDREQFCEMVLRAKNYIKEGDIFQAVLSNRAEADFSGSLLDVYRVLRVLNPSPYMFYFSSDKIEMAGASPETLVKMTDGKVMTFPLAGTRKRGATDAEDATNERDLLADEKELAEHNMLVDLGRNDLGKICEIGSVRVEKYLEVQKFSHVMHLGSTVTGTPRSDCDALDAVCAVLPAGTLSGAPKIRACEIINELENNKRGIYGGAIGYLDFTGNMDVCIAIRLVFAKNGKLFIRAGAGIVADSVPESEYQETVNKAKAVVEAIKIAAAGIE